MSNIIYTISYVDQISALYDWRYEIISALENRTFEGSRIKSQLKLLALDRVIASMHKRHWDTDNVMARLEMDRDE